MQEIRTPPSFCQYVDEACDQDFSSLEDRTAFFVYPGDPPQIAAAIEETIKLLPHPYNDARGWKTLHVAGQIIFCEVCKAMREADTIVADVSTLNFNLMFEVGFAIGLGLPVIPIRDTNYARDKRAFEELGVLDTVGFLDFRNSDELRDKLLKDLPGVPLPAVMGKAFTEQPLYVLKGKIETEGAIRLMASVKKSGLRFRTYDPLETTRLSMGELRRQIAGSHGIVAHLLSQHRDGSQVHNALCALACGIATAQKKAVLMVQEENVEQPIDYRDIVRPYTHPDQIPGLLETLIREVVSRMQSSKPATERPVNLLANLDLGDPAAENEIGGLKSYFVRTGQFTQAKQGHARLVVGRKGTGKTAIFYGVRDEARASRHATVLDLKPEGHQFTRLRETVLETMSPGLQEHTMTAFWYYVLLTEFARKIVTDEQYYSYNDTEARELYEKVKREHTAHALGREQDFSERLLNQIARLGQLVQGVPENKLAGSITQELYSESIHGFGQVIAEWLAKRDSCWLLVDNIDKGWPTRGTRPEDITIVRSLLDAVRKLQRQFQKKDADINCLVFLRSDIYDHLIAETADRGKDTAIVLEWNDVEIFRELLRTRLAQSIDIKGTFQELWTKIAESHVGSEESFSYMIERTLMRPRDLLQFLQRAIEVAINRGHSVITSDDIKYAERSFSEDLLLAIAFEIQDTYPVYTNVHYQFEGQSPTIAAEVLPVIIEQAGVASDETAIAIDLLLWYGFLGVQIGNGEPKYSYDVRHNVERLKALIATSAGQYVIHPGFGAALNWAATDT
jgi:hypothetical protein